MHFANRIHAGKLLAQSLQDYKDRLNTIVIGLPRGGVPVAYQVARSLHLPLDITCPHKIGSPFNPEYAIGAITESGEALWNEKVLHQLGLTEADLQGEVKRQVELARQKLRLYRGGAPPREVIKKTVILVDDGLATGFTMKAAVKSMRAQGSARIVIAVPVAPLETLNELHRWADEIVCLLAPVNFEAVGQFYREFKATTDQEVIEILKFKLNQSEII